MDNWEAQIHDLEIRIGYFFKDKELFRQALTHKSFVNEQLIKREISYERLEYLGDAVLDLIASEYLMDTYPEMAEGDLTKARAQIVCEPALANSARQLNLGQYFRLGKGEARSGGHDRVSILADVTEAIIGAIYRDSGLLAAKDFVTKFVLFESAKREWFLDSKSTIQEFVIKNGLGHLRYELESVSGPEHDKVFSIDLYLDGMKLSNGSGRSKKNAEQKAALIALESGLLKWGDGDSADKKY